MPTDFEARIVLVHRQEVTTKQAEFLVINVFSERVGMGVAQQAVIAVEGGEHAFEQGARGVAVACAYRVVGQPFSPLARHGRRRPGIFRRRQQVAEPGDAPPQCPHRALADEAVVRVNHAAEKVDALCAALQYDFVRVQLQVKAFGEEMLDSRLPCGERFGLIGQQDEVVDVAQVALDLEGVFDELVEFVEVNVGKELAGQTADGQPDTGLAVKQGFVRRNAAEQRPVAASHRRWVGRRLPDDGRGNLVELLPVLVAHRQARQCVAPEAEQHLPVDAGKERADVEFAVPAVSRLAHECLQSFDGGVRALVLAVGVAVVDEAFVPPGFDMADEPLMDETVDKGRRENLAQLGIGDGKNGEGLRGIATLRDGAGLRQDDFREADEVRTLLFAVACFCGTFEKLPGDLGFGQGV